MRHNKETTGTEPQMPDFQAANSDQIVARAFFICQFMGVMSVLAPFDGYIRTN